MFKRETLIKILQVFIFLFLILKIILKTAPTSALQHIIEPPLILFGIFLLLKIYPNDLPIICISYFAFSLGHLMSIFGAVTPQIVVFSFFAVLLRFKFGFAPFGLSETLSDIEIRQDRAIHTLTQTTGQVDFNLLMDLSNTSFYEKADKLARARVTAWKVAKDTFVNSTATPVEARELDAAEEELRPLLDM